MAAGDRTYSDPTFGSQKLLVMSETGALNGTVAATELSRYQFPTRVEILGARLRMKVGGTEAGIRQLIFSSSLAGTGALVALGTQALGTMADATFLTKALSGTLAAGDVIAVQHLGTGAGVYNVQPEIIYQELFANA